MENFIYIAKNALSATVCNTAIDIIENSIASNDGLVEKHEMSRERNDTALQVGLHDSESPFATVTKDINSLLRNEFREYNAKYEITNLPSKAVINTTVKYQKSTLGEGYTEWHTEQGVLRPDRFAVWMIYLNDVVKGGKTSWLHQECSVQPTQGTLVIWPAAYTHKHRADPDLQENKYIATGWFEYPSN